MPQVRFSPPAIRDLERLREFLRPKSPIAAKRAGEVIVKAVQVLGLQPKLGRPIEDIKLPEGVKIVTLVRGEQVIMAHHDTVIENGDHVILFLSDKRHVEQVERLFQT